MEIITKYHFVEKMGEHSPDSIFLFDIISQKVEYANTNFASLLGEANITNNSVNFLQLIVEDDREYATKCYDELLKNGFTGNCELRINKNGEEIYVSCTAVVLEEQKIIFYIRDISVVKNHENYLIKYTAQKDALLDTLTHNLSGPLILSKDLIKLAQQGLGEPGNKSLVQTLNIILENTQQCIDIVNDFLKKEYDESAATKAINIRFDAVEKIEQILVKFRELNQLKKITFYKASQSVFINSDPVKFFQVVHSLLSNALKFTDDSGRIDISLIENENEILISVQDDGLGIPSHIQEKIFKSKVYGSQGQSKQPSRGIGLLITKNLVEILNGKIWFESQLGKGSTFYIQLPT
jgi:two-component system, OmpR family, sensor histidine kinase VicK